MLTGCFEVPNITNREENIALAARLEHGAFVFTSNVDGQCHKAEPKLGGIRGIGLAMGAVDAVLAIHAALGSSGCFAET